MCRARYGGAYLVVLCDLTDQDFLDAARLFSVLQYHGFAIEYLMEDMFFYA